MPFIVGWLIVTAKIVSMNNFFQVWLQLVAAKLEKVKQDKRSKLNRLGSIIDKVVSAPHFT
jgi:hypothetical protein